LKNYSKFDPDKISDDEDNSWADELSQSGGSDGGGGRNGEEEYYGEEEEYGEESIDKGHKIEPLEETPTA
jgi:hypothetical protein